MSYKRYHTREDWLSAPSEEDRIEVHFGIYVDSDDKVKTFVSSEEADIPKDTLLAESGIITLAEADNLSSTMLDDLEEFASQIETIKHNRRIRTYFYGVVKSSRGKFSAFICKSQDKVPWNTIVTKKGKMVAELAYDLANELKVSLLENVTNCSVGDVVIYVDPEGQHTAIVLQKGRQYSSLIFVTTNPYWNKRSRPVTEDENMLLGYPLRVRGGISYFAPVVRLNKYIVETGKSFPLHRVEDFIEEFQINGC